MRQFQFHIGAIRSDKEREDDEAIKLFQFHIGAIRRLTLAVISEG